MTTAAATTAAATAEAAACVSLALSTPAAAGVLGAAAIGGALSWLTYATVAPASELWGAVVARGPEGSKQVALTFDDGPTPGATDRVLDVLRAEDARATFFVIGANVLRHPDLLRRIHDDGHQVGNHSFNHSHYTVFGRRRYWDDEIRRTDEAIASVLGERATVFRPPMGVRTWHTTAAARGQGHALVTWTRRAIDGLPTTPQRILRRFANPSGGEILLLHDGIEPNALHADRSATIACVEPLIRLIRERGLQPARLDAMFPPPEPGEG